MQLALNTQSIIDLLLALADLSEFLHGHILLYFVLYILFNIAFIENYTLLKGVNRLFCFIRGLAAVVRAFGRSFVRIPSLHLRVTLNTHQNELKVSNCLL